MRMTGQTTHWYPERLLIPSLLEPHSLIVLNNPLSKLDPLFSQLWKKSTLKVAADGGANVLYDMCLLPDFVVGIPISLYLELYLVHNYVHCLIISRTRTSAEFVVSLERYPSKCIEKIG